jgi:hypothetical protein
MVGSTHAGISDTAGRVQIDGIISHQQVITFHHQIPYLMYQHAMDKPTPLFFKYTP